MNPIVIVESPFAGDMEANRRYAIRACADCFRRGEIPFASHLLYPQILDELKPKEREQGITAGYRFWELANTVVFYMDYGMSSGMKRAHERALEEFMDVEERYLGKSEADKAKQAYIDHVESANPSVEGGQTKES